MTEILGEALELNLGESEVLTVQPERSAADVWFVANPEIYFGDCTVFRVGGRVGILDVGADKTGATVTAFLAAHGIDHVDYLILSHYHDDHIGGYENGAAGAGLSAILNSGVSFEGCTAYLPHGELVWDGHTFAGNYEAAQTAIKAMLAAAGITVVEPTEGQEVPIEGDARLIFRNLSPEKFAAYDTNFEWGDVADTTGTKYQNKISYNNFSMITELHHAGHVFLFPGDLERPAQAENAADISAPDVYRAEHHALNYRTDPEWYGKVAPSVAVIGELYPVNNAYARGRLTPATVLHAQACGGTLYAANESGTVHVRSAAGRLAHSCETGRLFSCPTSVFGGMQTFLPPKTGEMWLDRVDYVSGGTKIVGRTVHLYLRFRTREDYHFGAGCYALTWVPTTAATMPLALTVNGAGFAEKILSAKVENDDKRRGTVNITLSDALPDTGTADIIISGSYPLGT